MFRGYPLTPSPNASVPAQKGASFALAGCGLPTLATRGISGGRGYDVGENGGVGGVGVVPSDSPK